MRVTWGNAISMMAEQLGVTLDEIAGMKNGKNLISVAHVTRARHDLAPDWPRPLRGDGYLIIIVGEPRLDCEFEFSSETGEHLTGGWAITAMRAINAIPSVVAAEPGVKSVFDLPVITGRGRFG